MYSKQSSSTNFCPSEVNTIKSPARGCSHWFPRHVIRFCDISVTKLWHIKYTLLCNLWKYNLNTTAMSQISRTHQMSETDLALIVYWQVKTKTTGLFPLLNKCIKTTNSHWFWSLNNFCPWMRINLYIFHILWDSEL